MDKAGCLHSTVYKLRLHTESSFLCFTHITSRNGDLNVALAVVDDPTLAIQQLDDATTRNKTPSGRGVQAFNPLSKEDMQLFKAMMAGEHHIHGLSNVDIRTCLMGSTHLQPLIDNPKKQRAKVSRILNRFHAHKLIAKIPRSRKWRVTDRGKQIMAASLCLRDVAFPELFRKNMAA